jgi:hypothetical protein
MSFLRKASMKLKNEDGTTSPSSRSISSSSTSIRDDEDPGIATRTRKKSLA